MTDLPTSVWQGTFTLLGVEIRCHVLSDGQRIIEPESMDEFFRLSANSNAEIDQAELLRFSRWKAGVE